MRITTRLKKSNSIIRLVRPFELSSNDFIHPIFVREDEKTFPIPSIKGQNYLSLNNVVQVCRKTVDAGVPAVMVFGVLENKDADGLVALKKNGFHSKIFKKLKDEFGDDLVLISNICLCDYTSDEFCVYSEKSKVLNEKTAEMLAKIAVVHAKAGADVVAPSAMCDGQVRYIRKALDEVGLEDVAIMTYLKTDSQLFKPFFNAMTQSNFPRQSIDSSKFRSDVINEKMFMQKVDLDVSEGADIVIVKPALTNLDFILRIKQRYPTLPIAAYQVSGEYQVIKLLSEYAQVNEDSFFMETLNSIKRAGADMIFSYDAMRAASLVNKY